MTATTPTLVPAGLDRTMSPRDIAMESELIEGYLLQAREGSPVAKTGRCVKSLYEHVCMACEDSVHVLKHWMSISDLLTGNGMHIA